MTIRGCFYLWSICGMDLEKLFGSKTKVDIIKYLLFRRQWVSMRALENEVKRTFPAIKKQVDSLRDSMAIDVNTEWQWRSITIKKDFHDIVKNIFIYALKYDLKMIFEEYEVMIHSYYFGKRFWADIDMDLVVIYKNCEKPQIDAIKESINNVFKKFFIEIVSVVFMSNEEREKRYRLADKFVVNIMRNVGNMQEEFKV